MKESTEEQYHELCFYTLAHADISFIHQYVVDAYFAQIADEHTKPISITFALAGLYLFIEKNYTGRQVQEVHTKMSKNKRAWPIFTLPKNRGDINVTDVLAKPAGQERDEMIRKWCASVWEAYHENRPTVISLLQTELNDLSD